MRHGDDDVPPRWAEGLLRFFLRPRDLDTIAGDLLEEYREAVLPARGLFRARVWYVRQVLSLADGVTLGIIIGGLFGLWTLIGTQLTPLAEDSPAALAGFYLPMFAIWCVAAFAAYRRTGRLFQAIKVGATVGFVTFVVFDAATILRVNLFLDVIQQRDDWRNLVARYHESGFGSLRAYANYTYVLMTPLLLLIASTIGAATGLVGGVVAKSVGVLRHADGGMP